MSRGYRVRVPEPTWRNTTTRVEQSDALALDVGMLSILSEGEMTEMLRERLVEDGWSREGDGSLRRTFGKEGGEVSVELAPDGRTVTARASAGKDVTVKATSEVEANDKLARAAKSAERELTRAAAERLGAAEADIRAALQAALQKVYVEALQRKAAAMGQIESVHEGRGDDGELELTIKVRVP